MPRGKQTCKILKEIRKQIAAENDIELVISECTYQGDCFENSRNSRMILNKFPRPLCQTIDIFSFRPEKKHYLCTRFYGELNP